MHRVGQQAGMLTRRLFGPSEMSSLLFFQ